MSGIGYPKNLTKENIMIGNQQAIYVIIIRIILFISLFSFFDFFVKHLSTFDDFVFKTNIYPIAMQINKINNKLKLSKDIENVEAIADLK